MSEQMRNDGDEAETPVSAAPNTSDAGTLEKGPEHIPTPEEIHAVMGALMNAGRRAGLVREDGEHTETKRTVDEKGLYELDIEVPGVEEHEKVAYQYRRFAIPDRTDMLVVPPGLPEIHVAYYEYGEYVNGTSAARYVHGEWKFLTD
ncbi:MAG: hypothetical protein NTX63_03260 [Candidatus Peregrinibacteria bacterium]|nr:hypothetical protein [Candidatus Peregrinibacteria bacterium]